MINFFEKRALPFSSRVPSCAFPVLSSILGEHRMTLDFRQIPDLAPLRDCLSGYREALPLCKGLLYYYRNPDGKKWRRSSA